MVCRCANTHTPLTTTQPGSRAMANNSLNEISPLNQQVELQENIQEHLVKADAVAKVALNADFLDYEPTTIHGYLWALSDLISAAKALNEHALKALFQLE